jgi:hypothetical protein
MSEAEKQVRYRAAIRDLSPGDTHLWIRRGFFDLMAMGLYEVSRRKQGAGMKAKNRC